MGLAIAVTTGSGRHVRLVVEMSEHATFADAGVSNDVHASQPQLHLVPYTYGAAIALGTRSDDSRPHPGPPSLDDYMRRLWTGFGAPTPPAPGLVARPYTMVDLKRELGALLQDDAFAAEFFERDIEGARSRRLRATAGRGWLRAATSWCWAA